MTTSLQDQQHHYPTIVRILQQADRPPDPETLAGTLKTSPEQLRQAIHAWAGLSPQRFLALLTDRPPPGRLPQTATSPWLHGSIHRGQATPGATLRFGLAASPFGLCLLGWSDLGICHLAFAELAPGCIRNAASANTPDISSNDSLKKSQKNNPNTDLNNAQCSELKNALASRWPGLRLVRDQPQAAKLAAQLFSTRLPKEPVNLLLHGSAFQQAVWQALLTVPPGQRISYRQLAILVARPTAQRAVGQAVANNPLGYLVPCHRVVCADGRIGHYRWGSLRKQAMLLWEQSHTEPWRSSE